MDVYEECAAWSDENMRVVDLSGGKAIDDGYRGVHLYYQRSHQYFPIEIQAHTFLDRQFNHWLHKFVYKRKNPPEVGRSLRKRFEAGEITDVDEFKEVLQDVLSDID